MTNSKRYFDWINLPSCSWLVKYVVSVLYKSLNRNFTLMNPYWLNPDVSFLIQILIDPYVRWLNSHWSLWNPQNLPNEIHMFHGQITFFMVKRLYKPCETPTMWNPNHVKPPSLMVKSPIFHFFPIFLGETSRDPQDVALLCHDDLLVDGDRCSVLLRMPGATNLLMPAEVETWGGWGFHHGKTGGIKMIQWFTHQTWRFHHEKWCVDHEQCRGHNGVS